MVGGTLWHSHRFIQCIKYIILEFISSVIFLYSLVPPIPEIVSIGIILHLLTCVHILLHYLCPCKNSTVEVSIFIKLYNCNNCSSPSIFFIISNKNSVCTKQKLYFFPLGNGNYCSTSDFMNLTTLVTSCTWNHIIFVLFVFFT
jgi:hypothetical protein